MTQGGIGMKKWICVLLAALLLLGAAPMAFAEEGGVAVVELPAQQEEPQQNEDSQSAAGQTAINQSRAVIGADLTPDQVALVYQAFGLTRGSVVELTVTNAEERQYLEGYVDASLIGTRSISSVYVELLPAGASMDVTTSNITWCTPEMYMSALATAGITDARIVVASPFAVSGTAALTGVYKAYEDMTGRKLDDLAKAVSTQELTITGGLAQEIGSMDSTSIVNDLKLMLGETEKMSDEELRQEIIAIAKQYNVNLTDGQLRQLISLCRSLEGLDPESLKKRVEDVQDTLKKVSEAKTQVVGFVQTVCGLVIKSIKSSRRSGLCGKTDGAPRRTAGNGHSAPFAAYPWNTTRKEERKHAEHRTSDQTLRRKDRGGRSVAAYRPRGDLRLYRPQRRRKDHHAQERGRHPAV